MYKELRAEYGNDFAVPTHGCVSRRAYLRCSHMR